MVRVLGFRSSWKAKAKRRWFSCTGDRACRITSAMWATCSCQPIGWFTTISGIRGIQSVLTAASAWKTTWRIWSPFDGRAGVRERICSAIPGVVCWLNCMPPLILRGSGSYFSAIPFLVWEITGRAMERASIAYHSQHGGLFRSLALGALAAGTVAPGKVGRWAARRMTALAWRDFFDPFPPPPLGDSLLEGISAKAFSRTRRAALRAEGSQLNGVIRPEPDKVAILFGERDFLATLADRVCSRYPLARQIRLPGQDTGPGLKTRGSFAARCASSLRAMVNRGRMPPVHGIWPIAECQHPQKGERNL